MGYSFKNYREEHPYKTALYVFAGTVGTAAFIAGAIFTGGALLAVGGAGAAATAGTGFGLLVGVGSGMTGAVIASGGSIAGILVAVSANLLLKSEIKSIKTKKILKGLERKKRANFTFSSNEKETDSTETVLKSKIKSINIKGIFARVAAKQRANSTTSNKEKETDSTEIVSKYFSQRQKGRTDNSVTLAYRSILEARIEKMDFTNLTAPTDQSLSPDVLAEYVETVIDLLSKSKRKISSSETLREFIEGSENCYLKLIKHLPLEKQKPLMIKIAEIMKEKYSGEDEKIDKYLEEYQVRKEFFQDEISSGKMDRLDHYLEFEVGNSKESGYLEDMFFILSENPTKISSCTTFDEFKESKCFYVEAIVQTDDLSQRISLLNRLQEILESKYPGQEDHIRKYLLHKSDSMNLPAGSRGTAYAILRKNEESLEVGIHQFSTDFSKVLDVLEFKPSLINTSHDPEKNNVEFLISMAKNHGTLNDQIRLLQLVEGSKPKEFTPHKDNKDQLASGTKPKSLLAGFRAKTGSKKSERFEPPSTTKIKP